LAKLSVENELLKKQIEDLKANRGSNLTVSSGAPKDEEKG
jgi:hypothetical protein